MYAKKNVGSPLLQSNIELEGEIADLKKKQTGSVIPPRKQMTHEEEEFMRKAIEAQIDKVQANPKRIPKPLFCTPNCQHNHRHAFQYDYSKRIKDPRAERPGICFLEGLNEAPKNANTLDLDNASQSKGFGAKQTPIDLQTQMEVYTGFKDDVFKFNYEQVDAKKSLKFNEQGDCFFYQLNADQAEESQKQSFLQTKTISLFDQHISKAKLYGMQYHFHSPSEHSINGKLMDLEMHIVHGLQSDLTKGSNPSQFSHGVLGFLFKCMPESYFEEVSRQNQNIDFHDKFLSHLCASQAENLGNKPLDLTKFVELLKFNRRWTYQGSLTTIPCSEGILWNVIEQVIPIRQSTLDKFNYFRKVEEQQYTNKGNSTDAWLNEAKDREYPVNGNSLVKDGNKFMRIAVCNRKVVETNGRAVYHIDRDEEPVSIVQRQIVPQEYINQSKKYKWNTWSGFFFTCLIGLGNFQTGLAVYESSQLFSIFQSKFEWTEEEAQFNNLFLSAAAICGVIIGQNLGSCLVKSGRSKTIIIFNMLAMIATTMTLVRNYYLMCTGRLLFGLCCGVIMFAGQKMLEETMHSSLVSWSGAVSMVFLFLGVLTQIAIGLMLPTDEQAQKDTQMWRIPFAVQLAIEVLSVLCFEAFYPEDSVIFNISQGNDNDAMKLIKKIYPNNEYPEDILDEIKSMKFLSAEGDNEWSATRAGSDSYYSPPGYNQRINMSA